MTRQSPHSVKQIRRLLVPLFGMAIAATLALASSASEKEPAKWDQASVTPIAAKLSEAAVKLYDAIYDQGQPSALGAGKDYDELKQKIRLLRSESDRLANQLQKGKARDDTKRNLERISELNRDAAEFARQQSMTKPVTDALSAVEDLLRQLSPYYGL